MHQREMRRNIWRGLLTASDQEIRDGMDFYDGANGLCRLLAKVYRHSVDSVAGIYAALSPLNGWLTNVSNVVEVLRWRREMEYGPAQMPTVNTTTKNLDKAVRIVLGADPNSVLRGDKVVAFYRAILEPDNRNHYPIDRHLVNLALGSKITNNAELRPIVSAYVRRVEGVYRELGEREGLGNRLASIAWFVQRRSNRQMGMYVDGAPVCCGAPMWSHGRDRLYCDRCRKTRIRQRPGIAKLISQRKLPETVLTDEGNVKGTLPLSADSRGRIRIHLGKGQPYANSAGWQYLSRHETMKRTGEPLRRDEHVHHTNGLLWDCRTDNLEVWLEERHGRYHARKQLLYMVRDRTGRFMPSNVPTFDVQLSQEEELSISKPKNINLPVLSIAVYNSRGEESPISKYIESVEEAFSAAFRPEGA